jgi:intracellular sulfur oxidation DsrE/DsrF family protein
MKTIRILRAVMLAAAAIALLSPFNPALAQDKVVYHFDGGLAQATKGLRNINNHLEVDPTAKIVVVAHAQGVDFLMKGAEDANKNPYSVAVELLKERGVKFEVCEITIRNRKLDKKQFIPEVDYVPSGVVELAKLQAHQHFVYIKP